LLRHGRAATRKPLLAYPNSGEAWDAAAQSWCGDTGGIGLAERTQSWLEAGASMIGGCCRTGPADIRAIAGVLRPGAGAA
jgi:homocysteine S-methyltransferase